MNLRTGAVIFFSGGIALSLCDRVHIAYGVLEQANRSMFGQAPWVIPVFGLLSITVVAAFGWLRRAMGETARAPDRVRTTIAAVLTLGAYASTGPLDGWGSILLVVFAMLWVLRVAVEQGRCAVIFSLVLAAAGPLGEAAMSALGTFRYLHPDMGSVPSWLPGIYLLGGLLVAEVEAWVAPDRHEQPAVEPAA